MHLKVDRKKAEETRKKLIDAGALDKTRKIIRQGTDILIPITKEVDIPGTVVLDQKGLDIQQKPSSLKEALKDELSTEELSRLPKAFDIIGDIAIIEIPDELVAKKKVIADALLETFKNIKVVANKKTSVGTEYRTRDVEILAGEKRTETVHREAGCLYKLDVTKAYFSPRLGTERLRVARQVKEGERVLVLFAGIGPYAILIAKAAKPGVVYAVEINPAGTEYMKENIRLNKVDVKAILGDAKTVTPALGKFDRIIMPLPKDAGNFLGVALPAMNKCGVVNYYTFSHTTEEAADEVKRLCKELGYEADVIDSVECGTYSPCLFRMCVDFRVK
jgi:tRNA (guanine37-N1)-methyltransferase